MGVGGGRGEGHSEKRGRQRREERGGTERGSVFTNYGPGEQKTEQHQQTL